MVQASKETTVAESGNTTEPLKKKLRTNKKNLKTNKTEALLCDTLWNHYSNYFFVDHDEDEDEDDANDSDGETDQLAEILDLIRLRLPDAMNEVWELPTAAAATSGSDDAIWNRRHLVPVLISVVSTLLADECIEEYMDVETLISMATKDTTTSSTSTTETEESKTDRNPTRLQEQKPELLNQIRQHLIQALQSFPYNAAAIQMSTNYLRMTRTSTYTTTTTLAQFYVHAAEMAALIRSTAIPVVEDHNTIVVSDDVKEWIVALLLNQVCGVDEVEDDEEEDNEEEDEKVQQDKEDNIVWSSSKVEGISRYMSCMMYSMIQQHDKALEQLQLLGVTHRLHPKLWQTALPRRAGATEEPPPPPHVTSHPTVPVPISFRGERVGEGKTSAGVIPQHLYHRLCQVFQPGADYWYRSSYSSRGYFSFYMDLPPKATTATTTTASSKNTGRHKARNLVDDVVGNYLLPLIQQSEQYQDDGKEIVGYEWWVHTRAMTANLGHNLHFDTDEALLRLNGTVSHPCISSVLYLTGGDTTNNHGHGHDDEDSTSRNTLQYQGGPTIILDQTPDSTANAERVWYSHPINNSFMIFPGNLLHGVLPCVGPSPTDEGPISSVSMTTHESMSNALIQLLSEETAPEKPEPAKSPHATNRLTLMVGFWTRNVPDDMDPELTLEDKLYGPCSPLPSIHDTQWVHELCVGYNDDEPSTDISSDATTIKNIVTVPLPCISPAWEEIAKEKDSSTPTTPASLTIPRDVDHRFFVMDAPKCFHTQLMEAQNCFDTAYEIINKRTKNLDEE